jgi:DNA mismatch endonuclease (patch repair protein)
VAVFVDGCFWHVCPEHSTRPASNESWWAAKLERNQARDRETTAHLECLGWIVVRVWEHVPATVAADIVEAALGRRSRESATPDRERPRNVTHPYQAKSVEV